jgi:hypothetical protein
VKTTRIFAATAAGLLLAAACSDRSSPTGVPTPVTSSPNFARVSGAAFTTNNPDEDGSETCQNGNQSGAAVNCNIYTEKKHVWINGGPAKQGAAGLSEGWYFFAVTEPGGQAHNPADGGAANLSDTDEAGGRKGDPCDDKTGCGDTYLNRRFYVDKSGEIVQYMGDGPAGAPDHDTYESSTNGLMIRLMRYDNTSNPGGVYILALCQIGTTRRRRRSTTRPASARRPASTTRSRSRPATW